MTSGVDAIFEVMKTQIKLNCPDCHSIILKKNGKKSYGKQSYQYKDCNRQFIGDHALSYQGCHSTVESRIRLMLVGGCGIKDIAKITSVSIGKLLSTLQGWAYQLFPKRQYYQKLEVDEFWTYVGKKKRKVWLIYAYERHTGVEVWGKRDLKNC